MYNESYTILVFISIYVSIVASNFYKISLGGSEGRRTRNGTVPDWVELAGLFARMWAVRPLQEGDSELQVLDRVVSRRLQVHV